MICHALTSYVVAPIQSVLFPDMTVFASLLFLPHGVRVLATWAYGWTAVPALTAAGGLSAWLFRSQAELNILQPALLSGIVMGAVSALLAFELLRLLGNNVYAGRSHRLNWVGLLSIGGLSSLINSIGQTFIHAGLAGFENAATLFVVFAIGDLAGLIICMIALMLIFRWVRLSRKSAN